MSDVQFNVDSDYSEEDGCDRNEVPCRDLESDVEISDVDSSSSENEHLDGVLSEYDSDDDIPLAELIAHERWSKRIRNPEILPFTQTVGPTVDEASQSMIECFYGMFSEEFFDVIAAETNRYARQQIQKKMESSGKGDSLWENQGDVSSNEMKAFFSVNSGCNGLIICANI